MKSFGNQSSDISVFVGQTYLVCAWKTTGGEVSEGNS